MTGPWSPKQAETLQLLLLLAVDTIFFFVIIPHGVQDPEGFGWDQGLPPSFSVRLVAAIAAILMLGRLVKIHFAKTPDPAAAVPAGRALDVLDEDAEPDLDAGVPVRGIMGMAAALIFSIVLVPIAGFFIGSAALLVSMLLILGERRLSRLAIFPGIVILLIWILFGQLLSIRLPVGWLFSG